jgi:hypothetical protein
MIGRDEWRSGKVSKNTSREIRMKIVESVTSSESSELMKRSQQAQRSEPAGKRQVSLTSGERELSVM